MAFNDTTNKTIPDQLGAIQHKVKGGEPVSYQEMGQAMISLAKLHDPKLEKEMRMLTKKAAEGDEFSQGVLLQTSLHAVNHIQQNADGKHPNGNAFTLTDFVKSGDALKAVEDVKTQLPEGERLQAEAIAQVKARKAEQVLGQVDLASGQRFASTDVAHGMQPEPGVGQSAHKTSTGHTL